MATKDRSGDLGAHHLWWCSHLPRVEDETDGISNNRGREYIVDPNKV